MVALAAAQPQNQVVGLVLLEQELLGKAVMVEVLILEKQFNHPAAEAVKTL
jgi:hypothetical protein